MPSLPWPKKPSLLAFSLLVAFRAMLAPTGHAQRSRADDAAPQVLQNVNGTVEIGTLAGVEYRIDIPANWNRSLVVYYHGYSEHGVSFHPGNRLRADLQVYTDRHYAVAQSAYSEPGWAVQQAYPETEALRLYFEGKYGRPRDTYVAGSSMGGALVMITLELDPKPYIGGLDLCGAVGPTFYSFDRRFALRAAFDHFFPGVMGPLVPVPLDFDDTAAVREKIASALRSSPDRAAQMRELMDLHTDISVARDISYFTFVIGDMQRRSGGNPFDNRNWIYAGTSSTTSSGDEDLNATVHRYAANQKARDYLVRHYSPTGRLGRPMLALHTLYDPVVPVSLLGLYNSMVLGAGQGERFVQQYVTHEGHCAITPEEVSRAFDDLVTWTHGGPRPVPGLQRGPAPAGNPVAKMEKP